MKKLSLEKLNMEKKRLYEMTIYERQYEKYKYICGIDEAGRGPLAGPVVAAAVILPKNCEILYLNDSKKLSPKKRMELFYEIKEKALDLSVGIVDAKIIDEINILQATYKAMKIAINNLNLTPDILLNDAVKIPNLDIPQVKIIKGDAKSISIAASSVIAKVTRDMIMQNLPKEYDKYEFKKHKGYGTKLHYEKIERFGISDIHRKTFLKKILK